jgi:Tfp pilus assembly protein PilX
MKRIQNLQDESGSALVAGILILMIISMLGVVVLQTANVQTRQTGTERAGEQAFNLAESALNAEASLLEVNWPISGTSGQNNGNAYPVCTQASTSSVNCPQGSISTGFSATYAGSGFASPTWSVQVIDDDAPAVADTNYYSDTILTNNQLAHWDSNGDNKLWIRADATIRGQHRILVASIGRQTNIVSLPQAVVTSGGMFTGNNGNKVIIEAKDPSSGLSGSVDLRCGTSGTQPAFNNNDTCAGWDPNQGQLDPPSVVTTGYMDPSNNYQTLSNGVLEQLRESAKAAGTYFPVGQCPLYGATGLLFVENANCSYAGTGGVPWGSDTAPVALVVASGTLTFGANVTYYGVLYLADGQGTIPTPPATCSTNQPSSNVVFTVQGGGAIHGGLFVDKCGTVNAGDKAFDINYDVKAFGGVKTTGTPSLEQNTFRIVSNGGS